jgi:hypothetical protein
MVEHMPYQPKVKGLSLANTDSTGRDKMDKVTCWSITSLKKTISKASLHFIRKDLFLE